MRGVCPAYGECYIAGMDSELKRKLAAILVADVVGYSRLIADDEEATLRRLEVFRGLWQDCVTKTGGRIFNTAGDAVLAEFPSAVEALRCALDFQAQAKAQNDGLVPTRQMHFRVGITIGDVVERRGDLLGDGVNIAARLQTLAGAGGICVSSWVREAVTNKIGVEFSDLGDQSVKNIPTPIRAYLARGAGSASSATRQGGQQPQDWLSRAMSSGKGMAALVGGSALAVLGALVLVSQMQPGPAPPSPPGSAQTAPTAKTEIRDVLREAGTQPKAPAKAPEPQAAPKSIKVEPASAKSVQPAEVQPPARPADSATPPRMDGSVRRGMLNEAAERGLRDGDRFKECETCPEMVVVPRGDFIMGSTESQPGHERDEAPTRKVTIGTRIAVARHPVTLGEYETFVAVTGYRPGAGCRIAEAGKWVERAELSFRNPGFTQAADHPVVCVNWNDAKAFTDWMTARMSADYRLPTEAEREFFTRAGTGTLFWWGNEIGPDRAAYDWSHTFGAGTKAEMRRGTHPAGAFRANPWGLLQVHGNVSEWVEDCWNGSYRGAPADGTAWTTGDCKLRVLRGGSWGYAPKDLRAAYREGATLTNRNFNFGFRVVRVLRGAGR